MPAVRRKTCANASSSLLLLACCACGVSFEEERYYLWHELSPPPSKDAVSRFGSKYPATPVTTTQPNSWDKIEVGMSRGMVRTLVGERLRDPQRFDAAYLDQAPPPHTKWTIKLFFGPSPANERQSNGEDDILHAIIIWRKVNRPIQSTDWP